MNNKILYKILIFRHDLKNFKNNSNAQIRLECQPSSKCPLIPFLYFDENEINKVLNYASPSGNTFKQLLDGLLYEKEKQKLNSICTSHDIIPIIDKVFQIEKDYFKQKEFKEEYKEFEKEWKNVNKYYREC